MPEEGRAEPVEWFRSTSGKAMGVVGLVGCGLVFASPLFDGFSGGDLPLVLGALLVALLIWATMLRPRAGVTHEVLVLRGAFSDVSLPLAAIEEVALRQMLAVRVGERRWVSPSVGRTLRQMRRGEGGGELQAAANYGDFVEERIRARMEEARTRSGVGMPSPEQAGAVRREWALPELAALVLLAVGLVLSIVI